jgi:hypothetical protein
MSVIRKATIVAVGALATAMFVAAPASADPADNPCTLAVTFLCQFVPMAPELDHDIDLTQPSGDSAIPPPAAPIGEPPPADICANGCY